MLLHVYMCCSSVTERQKFLQAAYLGTYVHNNVCKCIIFLATLESPQCELTRKDKYLVFIMFVDCTVCC